MSNEKYITFLLIAGLIKRHCIKMSQYFPKPYRNFGGNIDVKVVLSNYATKTDVKDATGIDTSNFALKSNLTNLKTEVDKIDVAKLKTVPAGLSKLRNVAKKKVIENTGYDKLVTKVNNIDDPLKFILKAKYDTDKSDLEKKISDAEKETPDTSGRVKKTDLNSKITEIESKMVSGLATNSALTKFENKIPDI